MFVKSTSEIVRFTSSEVLSPVAHRSPMAVFIVRHSFPRLAGCTSTLRVSHIESMMMIAMMREMALPKFQSPEVRNCDSMMLPTSTNWPPPRSFGMKKLETAGRNTSVMPEMTPGRESGSVTRRNACTGVAPRSLAASSRLLSILASEVWICRTHRQCVVALHRQWPPALAPHSQPGAGASVFSSVLAVEAQATRAKTMTTARSSAMIFFICSFLLKNFAANAAILPRDIARQIRIVVF